MPVVINEFEVVAAPDTPAPPASADKPKTAAQGVTPHDVERIVAHARARDARVRAH